MIDAMPEVGAQHVRETGCEVRHAPAGGQSRARRAAFWCIGFGVSGLAMFAVAEVFLRLFVGWAFTAVPEVPMIPSAVPGLVYVLAPGYSHGAFRTDAYSMRMRSPDAAAPRHRVLLVGDSIAFGSGVPYEKSFAPLLENALTRLSGENTAVFNAAVPGYNTVQEAIRLELIGPSVRPDLVLVQFCMNDYQDALRLTPSGTLDATQAGRTKASWILALPYYSRTFIFAREKFKDLEHLRPEWFPVWAHYIHYVPRRPGWRTAKAALRRVRDSARRLGARSLVVIFPVEQQLRISDRAAQDDLIAYARQEGIDVLDLYPAFQAHWREGLYVDYWRQAGVVDKLHPNQRGHALAAAEIAARVLSGRYLE